MIIGQEPWRKLKNFYWNNFSLCHSRNYFYKKAPLCHPDDRREEGSAEMVIRRYALYKSEAYAERIRKRWLEDAKT
jgi:hypothetical protein